MKRCITRYPSGNLIRALFGWGILVMLTLAHTYLWGQQYPTRRFTMQDGLPGMNIQCIFKDSRGLLWIGTRTGLCTYDGKQFRIIGRLEGLNSTNIWSITEDKHGDIWLGSIDDGVIRYDGRQFEKYDQKRGLADNRVRVLEYSKKYDCIVAGTYEGFSKITRDTILNFPEPGAVRDTFNLTADIADMGEFMYIATYGYENPIRFYPGTNQFVSLAAREGRYPTFSFASYLTSKGDTVFSKDREGVRVFTQHGRIIENTSMGQIFNISEDNDGNLWFASWSYPGRTMVEGVFKYDGHTFTNYKDAFGITDKEIWTVLYDREQDILWIGTTNEGLFEVTFSGIEIYTPSMLGLPNQKLNDVYADNEDRIWITATDELARMDPNGRVEFMDPHPRLVTYGDFWAHLDREIETFRDSLMIEAVDIPLHSLTDFEQQFDFNYQYIIGDPPHSVLFSNRFGLFSYNTLTGIQRYLDPETATKSRFSIMGEDTLITHGWGSTMVNTKFRHESHNIKNSDILLFTENSEPRNTRQVTRMGTTQWYVSETDGLWKSQGMHLERVFDTDSLLSSDLNVICLDHKNRLIIGSNSGEVFFAGNEKDTFRILKTLSKEDGILGNSISWLFVCDSNKLWIGTNLGINILNLDSLYYNGKAIIQNMNHEEGYTTLAAQKAVSDSRGNLWLTDGDQLVKLNREKFLAGQNSSGRLIISGIEINSRPVDVSIREQLDPWTWMYDKIWKLRSRENNLTFYFNVLNYRNPGKDRYRYYLEGFDDHWSNYNESGKIAYSNLPSGTYTLHVEALNLQSLKGTETVRIPFEIQTPWWQLWYLRLALLGLIISGIHLYISNNRRNKQRKHEMEKTMAELQIKALQAQMNPHFIFNSINGIQYYILDNKTDKVLGYLSDFSKVVRTTMEHTSKKWIPISEEMEFLSSYLRLEQMRFPDKFEFDIHWQGNHTQPGAVQIPPMTIQPFVENSIRHGFTAITHLGKIGVTFEMPEENLVKITVTDNGKGRPEEVEQPSEFLAETRKHSGSLTSERIKLLNTPENPGRFRVTYTDLSEEGKRTGLKVELWLPAKLG